MFFEHCLAAVKCNDSELSLSVSEGEFQFELEYRKITCGLHSVLFLCFLYTSSSFRHVIPYNFATGITQTQFVDSDGPEIV